MEAEEGHMCKMNSDFSVIFKPLTSLKFKVVELKLKMIISVFFLDAPLHYFK